MTPLGKVTQTLKGGPGLTLVDQAFVSLANFVTVFVLARSLEPDTFGLVALVLSTLLLLTAVQSALVGHVHGVLGPRRGRQAYESLTGHLLTLQIVFGLVVTVLAFSLVPFAHLALGEGGRDTALCFGIVLFPWLVQDAARRMFYTDRRPGAALLNDVLCYGTQAAGAALLALDYLPRNLNSVAWIYGTACVMGALAGLAQLAWIGLRFERATFWSDLAAAWKISRFLAAGQFVQTGTQNLLNWMIIGLAGLPVLGAYRALVHLANIINPLEQAVFLYLPPRASERFGEHGPAAYVVWYRRIAFFIAGGVALLLVGIGVVAEPLIALAYGDAYASYGALSFLSVILLYRGIKFVGSLFKSGVVSTGKSSLILRDALAQLVLVGMVGPILLGLFGLTGVALLLLTTAVPLTAYAYWSFSKIASSQGMPRTASPEPGAKMVDGGAYADVYRTADGKAVKQYLTNPATLELARRERDSLRKLARAEDRRPRGVAIPRPFHGTGEPSQVVMQWADGSQLHRFVQTRPLTTPQKNRIARRLADGVAHYQEVMGEPFHDLTPLNLIWDPDTKNLWFIDVGSPPTEIEMPKVSEDALSVGYYLGWILYQHARPVGRTSLRALADHASIVARQFRLMRLRNPELSLKEVHRAAWWRYREITHTGAGRKLWFGTAGKIPAGLVLGLWTRKMASWLAEEAD